MFKFVRSSLATTLAAFAIAASSIALAPAASAQSDQSPTGLTGAWWVTVTQYNCSTGVKRPPFSSILLFSRGGTLTETTSNPGFLVGQRSAGFGTWSLSANGTYAASDVAYILFTGGLFTQGTQKISHTITLNSDASQFADEAVVQFYDTTGALLLSGCASATASRLQ